MRDILSETALTWLLLIALVLTVFSLGRELAQRTAERSVNQAADYLEQLAL